jgi:hypothetical protein
VLDAKKSWIPDRLFRFAARASGMTVARMVLVKLTLRCEQREPRRMHSAFDA